MAFSILLRCQSLIHTKSFYQDVLGFEAQPVNESTLAFNRFGATILFTELNPWQSSVHMSGTMYFSVPDIDQLFKDLRAHVELAWDLQDMPYGTREFGIRDYNGYFLAFMQDESVQ